MKSTLLRTIAIAIACGCWTSAQAQLETPAASPKGKVEQRVGVMDVTIEYSRPGVKGRKVFGDLVPYGEVWRTGANAPTTISFSDPVKLEGKDIPAGKYSLYTIPGEQEWTIIINKKASGGRDEKEDQATFKIRPTALASSTETFTINVTDIRTSTANVELAWDKTSAKFKMEFDVDAKVMAAIKKAMENPLEDVASMYFQSASYYYENGKDLKQALEWINKSLEINGDPFFIWRVKSQIQAALKDYKGAIASAETSKAKAKEAGNDQFVKFNDDAIAEWKKMK
ncbi:MAG TPA: DUF2911 domain-containing protein [Bacteroidota bacterium]